MGIFEKRIRRKAAALLAGITAAASLTAVPQPVQALVTDPAGDYDNFAKALQYSLHFYDANMCGPEVEDHSRFKWRANCHTYDAYVPLKPMDKSLPLKEMDGTNLSSAFIEKYHDILCTGTKPDTVDVSGGYHDAGDHVKFGLPEAYAGSVVSWGYYEFPQAYVECKQVEHVETIIRHFCDYFMRCTFRDENGDVVAFCYQVGDGDVDHSYWQLPQNDTMVRTAWFATADNPTTCNVSETAACLAINYLNFKESDPEYAEKCLDYSLALYDFATKNDKAIADTEQGPKGYYGSTKWEDDYSFASCWLYLITGDNQYIDNMLPIYDYYAPPGFCFNWNDMWNGVGLLMGRISEIYKSGKTYTEKENPLHQNDLVVEYMKAAGKNPYEQIDFWGMCAKAYHKNMSGSPGSLSPQGYLFVSEWGSCRYNTAVQLCMLIYDKYNKGVDKDYEQSDTKVKDYGFTEWAKGQMEYILGNNDIVYKETGGTEHGPRCFLTGFDDHSAAYPHHRASSGLTKCEDPDEQLYVLFGALCGGPTGQDEHNDLTGDWRENEVTIDYNAACPGAAAALYLAYKDQYPQSITPDFPPVNDGGRASKGGGGEDGEGGASGTWVEACGIDDFTDTGAGVTKVSLMVKSTSGKTPKNLTVRYYIDTTEISDFSKIESSILYDQVSAEAAPDKCTIQQPKKWDKDSKYAYVEMDWGDYNFPNCGKKLQFKVGFYYGDKWDPTNDPSYKDLKIYKEDDAFFGTGNEVRTDNICVYSDGVLIGGIEPDGTEPEASQPQNPTPTTTSITTTTTTKTTTTTTTTDPKIVREKGMRGDVDCSEDVDVSDAVLLARFLAEDSEATVTETGMRNADCDGIAGVDSNDVIAILKHIAQIELLED